MQPLFDANTLIDTPIGCEHVKHTVHRSAVQHLLMYRACLGLPQLLYPYIHQKYLLVTVLNYGTS